MRHRDEKAALILRVNDAVLHWRSQQITLGSGSHAEFLNSSVCKHAELPWMARSHACSQWCAGGHKWQRLATHACISTRQHHPAAVSHQPLTPLPYCALKRYLHPYRLESARSRLIGDLVGYGALGFVALSPRKRHLGHRVIMSAFVARSISRHWPAAGMQLRQIVPAVQVTPCVAMTMNLQAATNCASLHMQG